MTAKVGSLHVDLGLETARFTKGLGEAQAKLGKTMASMASMGDRLAGLGQRLSLVVTAPLAGLAAKGIAEAQATAQAVAQVESALASMGPVAGRTSAQLQAAAEAFEKTSLLEADTVLKDVTATLLTFGNISGQEFDRAQQAAIDMAQRFNLGPQAAALALGKALNDPIKGITALSRAGVSFSAQQRSLITSLVETGRVAEAQQLALGVLEQQVRGAAAAAQNADPFNRLQDAFNNLAEAIGTKLLPRLTPLIEGLTAGIERFSALPSPVQDVIVVAGALAAAIGPVLTVTGSLLGTLAKMPALLGAVKGAMGLLFAHPAIAGMAVAVGAIYLAWQNWDKIEPIVQRLFTGVKTWLQDKLGGVLDWVTDKVRKVERAFHWMADQVVFNSHVPDMVAGIAHHMGRLAAVMVAPALRATSAVSEAMRAMAQDTQEVLDRLFPEVRRLLEYRRELAVIDRSGLSEAEKREARRRLGVEFGESTRRGRPGIEIFEGTLAPDMDKVGEAIKRLTERAGDARVRIVKSFKEMADETLASLSRLHDSIRSGGFLGILESVIGFGLQLGSVGLFGSKVAGRINAPARALGGPVMAGRPYLVGEMGPELVVPPRPGNVIPNHALGGGRQVIEIFDTTGLFRMKVNGQIMEAAPGIARAGARGGEALVVARGLRRLA